MDLDGLNDVEFMNEALSYRTIIKEEEKYDKDDDKDSQEEYHECKFKELYEELKIENNDLNGLVENKKKQINRLSNEKIKLIDECSKLRCELKDFKEKFDALSNKLSLQDSEIEVFKSKIESNNLEFEHLKLKNETLEAKLVELKEQRGKDFNLIKQLEQDLQKSQLDRESLLGELTQAKNNIFNGQYKDRLIFDCLLNLENEVQCLKNSSNRLYDFMKEPPINGFFKRKLEIDENEDDQRASKQQRQSCLGIEKFDEVVAMIRIFEKHILYLKNDKESKVLLDQLQKLREILNA